MVVSFKYPDFLKTKENFSRITIKLHLSFKSCNISEHLLTVAISGSIIKYQATGKLTSNRLQYN